MTLSLFSPRNERSVRKSRPQSCEADDQKTGGTMPWNAVVPCTTCTIKLPMARHHSREDMVRNSTDHQFYLEPPRKTSEEWEENAERDLFLGNVWEEVGQEA